MPLLGLVLAVLALWNPHASGSVPEWKLQIMDQSGKLAVGAQVSQQWIDPIDDGIVSVDSRTTDAHGFVLFRRACSATVLRLGLLTPHRVPGCLSAGRINLRILIWDGQPSHLAAQLVLKKGAPARMVETGEYKAKNNICFLFAMMLLCSSSFSTGAP
ncbi:MAG: hypothetical protein JWN63_2265 [Candidatus Acidoferrum typicum]|nr:hypothetical protein [Candidatus Acidoferrum typicum]